MKWCLRGQVRSSDARPAAAGYGLGGSPVNRPSAPATRYSGGSARGNAEHDGSRFGGRGELGQRGPAVHLEHSVLADLPDVVHRAAAAHVAAVLVIEADVELH